MPNKTVLNTEVNKNQFVLGCPRNSVDTEFRLFFFTSVYSVFRAELAKIPPEFP
jgi:hypothetical protein